MLSTQLQYSTVTVDRNHCVNRVLDQIDDDLLQLTTVAHYGWQFRFQMNPRYNVIIFQFSIQSAQCPKSQVIHVDRTCCARGSSKQGANVVEYLTDTMTRQSLFPLLSVLS